MERLKCGIEAARSLVTGEVATFKLRVELLKAQVANLEATAAGYRADYERERDRADRLIAEFLKASDNTTRAMEAKLEGEIALLRLAAEANVSGDGSTRSANFENLDELPCEPKCGAPMIARGRQWQ
jgi:hypothetical protein